ncbi:hypothetical protein KR009_003367, partial [Drosophila setifemur]
SMEADAAHRERLTKFVATGRARLLAILQRLQWSEEEERRENVKQPKEVEHLPLSNCTDPAFSVQLDDAVLKRILGTTISTPSSFDDLQSGLNASQRLLVYEHVMEHTGRHPQFPDNAAFAELVGVTKREQMKQRRHRKSKPTLNEELHQLLHLQMDALRGQWRGAEQHERRRSRERSCSRKRSHVRKRSRSRERSHNRKRSRSRIRKRSRERESHNRKRSRSRESNLNRERLHHDSRKPGERRSKNEGKQHRRHRSRSRSRSRSPNRRRNHKRHR